MVALFLVFNSLGALTAFAYSLTRPVSPHPALWWTLHLVLRLRARWAPGGVKAGQRGGGGRWVPASGAVTSVWFPLLPATGALHRIEPWGKFLLPMAGLVDELVPYAPLFDPHTGALVHSSIHNWQHVAMYLGIISAGALDLLIARRPALALRDGPTSGMLGVDGVALAAAFASQGFVLVFHLTGPELDIRLHSLLVVASFLTAASIALALACPRSNLLAYLRCVCLLALGSFWIQTGDLSYRRPAFDTNEGVAIAPLLLLAHYGAWGVAVLVLLALAASPPAPQGGAVAAVSMHRRRRGKEMDVDLALEEGTAAEAKHDAGAP